MITIKQILGKLKGAEYIGNAKLSIKDVIQLDPSNKRNDVLTWCNDKNIARLSGCHAGLIICSPKVREIGLNKNVNYIIVARPRRAFFDVLNAFFVTGPVKHAVSKKAHVHRSVKIGKNVFIGDFAVIEKNCVIGDNSSIGHNTILHEKTVVGKNVKIGCNNTIGGIGFGYEKDETGDLSLVPHIGNVVIEDQVEIGNNTCIDRAVLGSTLIKRNTKIDNLVHVAHGVMIGENSLIIANSMLGGSCIIGKNVWISPSVSVLNKSRVDDNALVGMGAVVLKPVEENTIVVGNPAKFLKKKSD